MLTDEAAMGFIQRMLGSSELLGRLEETNLRLSFQENHSKLCNTNGLMRNLGLLHQHHSATLCCQDLSVIAATDDKGTSATSAPGSQPHRPHQSPDHMTQLPLSPAKEEHYAIFSFSLCSSSPQFHTNASFGRAQGTCLSPTCKGGDIRNEYSSRYLGRTQKGPILLSSEGRSKAQGILQSGQMSTRMNH